MRRRLGTGPTIPSPSRPRPSNAAADSRACRAGCTPGGSRRRAAGARTNSPGGTVRATQLVESTTRTSPLAPRSASCCAPARGASATESKPSACSSRAGSRTWAGTGCGGPLPLDTGSARTMTRAGLVEASRISERILRNGQCRDSLGRARDLRSQVVCEFSVKACVPAKAVWAVRGGRTMVGRRVSRAGSMPSASSP